ncbi:pirin family protein, partial [Pseudomonas aeruginosa]
PFDRLPHANHGWPNARHPFSFADSYDPERAPSGPLPVWNDDEIPAGSGFPPHPHRDMDIITYVRESAITNQESLSLIHLSEPTPHVATSAAVSSVKKTQHPQLSIIHLSDHSRQSASMNAMLDSR